MAISTIGSNSLNPTSDLVIDGVTVGRGGGTVSTNTAVGASALASNSTGAYGVAVGYQALQNTTGNNNTAVGYQAGYTNITGVQNTFIGYQAGQLATGAYNCFVGTVAGSSTTGQLNSFIGYGAGTSVTSGSKNTILGAYSGNQQTFDIRTLSNAIVVSDGDGYPGIGRYTTTSVSTTFVTISPYAGVGGLGMVTAYTSGGAQGTWWVLWQYNTATVVASNNGTGLTISFQALGGNLQIRTASGTLAGVACVFLI
jgi:hypothetical protein